MHVLPIKSFLIFQGFYIPMMIWTLVLGYTTGSFNNVLAINHRNTQSLAIIYPLLFVAYHGLTAKYVNPIIFIIATIISSLSQISSYQLLKTRVPTYDVSIIIAFMFSIIEQFESGVMIPLLLMFGHLEAFEIFRLPFLIIATYVSWYSWGLLASLFRARLSLPKGYKLENNFAGWKKAFKGTNDQ